MSLTGCELKGAADFVVFSWILDGSIFSNAIRGAVGDVLIADEGRLKRCWGMAVFGGAIGVATTASRLDWTQSGDSSRSRRDESLASGVLIDRFCT